jgi:carbon monoxide dehydrogenase subunit G
MEIADSFRVSTPIADTWKVLLDIEGIAPCLPGAQLQEIEGDEYRGIVKVKVGPITAQYKGTATLAEVDEPGRRLVIDAAGRDTRGQGNAKATIVVTMLDDAGGTRVEVATDLAITGKVAQFGRGVLVDVSSKLMRQFVENLERDVLATQQPEAVSDLPVSELPGRGPAAESPAETAAAPTPAPVAATNELRRIESKEVEPIDLFDMAGQSAAKRLIPLGIGVVLILVLWRFLRSRG